MKIIKTRQSAGLVATVVDSLESNSATDALSAKQGRILNEKIDEKSTKQITTGQEYPTNEYIDGKRVYEKIFKTTATFDTAIKNFNHGITGVSKIWVDLSNSYFRATTNNACYPLPMIYYGTNNTAITGVQVWVDSNTVNFITSNGGWGEAWEKVVRLKYTKA